MFRRLPSATRELVGSSMSQCRRGIRTQIPPRPSVTVVAYLDHYGNVIRGKEETEISLVRTRDNKFYLQRVYPNEAVVRFLCPGLSILKGAANFEYFSLADVDHHGGIIIPSDVMPTPAHEPPGIHDAVLCLSKCEQTKKFTRKDRRSWHRRLHAHWTESPEKYQANALVNIAIFFVVATWVGLRYWWMYTHDRSFWEDDIGPREPRWAEKAKSFSDRHPEQSGSDMTPLMWSPAQHLLSQARSDMRGTEHQDTTGWQYDLIWKIRHAYYYRHWPASLD